MLTPSFLSHIADKMVDIWERVNLYAVRDICRRISDAEGHMTASAEWQIYKLQQAGLSRDSIQREMQRILHASDEEMRELFEESVIESYNNDAEVFREAGIPDRPFDTKQARKGVQTVYDQTEGELYNYTRTTANESQQIYIRACDEAYAKIKSGITSPEVAIRQAIDEAARDGLYITYPSGHRDTVEVAVRRAVMTGINRASIQLTLNECEANGTNFVIVSSHLGARVSKKNHIANHYGWQGQIYRIKDRPAGFWGKLQYFQDVVRRQNYPLLREATGYPDDPLGLGGYNCRHSVYPYIPGISQNRMTKFDAEENAEKFSQSQEQRGMEREMRRTKRRIAGARAGIETALDEATAKELAEQAESLEKKLKEQIRRYGEFCAEHELTPQMERTYTVYG